MVDKFWSAASIDNPADLRSEFNKLIDGSGMFDGIGVPLLLRDMSPALSPSYCPVEGSTYDDDKYFQGESHEWVERFVRGYFTQSFGRGLAENKVLIYLKFDADPKFDDAIYRIRTNTHGKIYYPIERIEKWVLTGVEDRRYDDGKIAYFLCVGERQPI